MANDQDIALGADFPAASREQWLALVDKVLAGAPFDRKLVSSTYDGLVIQPLYTSTDAPPPDQAGLPGSGSFTRGSRPGANSVDGWDVRQFHSGDDLAKINRAILEDLEAGVTSIVLGPMPVQNIEDLDTVLAGVYLDLIVVALDWGQRAALGGELLRALWQQRGVATSVARADVGADPFGEAAAGQSSLGLEAAVVCAKSFSGLYPNVRALRVDAARYADAGTSEAQELAFALSGGAAYLRALTEAGLGIDDACHQLSFRLAATADQFLTMAKLRAARRLWARVAEVSGASPAARAMALHTVTSQAMYSQRDSWVNPLRATLACFAAATAGADAITVLPHGIANGQLDDAGNRLARNTQIMLAEESGLTRVIDPGGGSWYVEDLTEKLAQAAWEQFQAIEAQGGMAAVLASGWAAAEVERTWTVRLANLSRRKDALTGVSEFPNLADPPPPASATSAITAPAGVAFPLRRLAAPFEALRDAADTAPTRPGVFLANLGPIATHTARASFATNFFAVGGIEAVTNDGFENPADAAAAYKASGAALAVICSSDAVYGEFAEDTARELVAAGADAIYLAGNPGSAHEAYQGAGITDFVYVGCDSLEVLRSALATVGILQRS